MKKRAEFLSTELDQIKSNSAPSSVIYSIIFFPDFKFLLVSIFSISTNSKTFRNTIFHEVSDRWIEYPIILNRVCIRRDDTIFFNIFKLLINCFINNLFIKTGMSWVYLHTKNQREINYNLSHVQIVL